MSLKDFRAKGLSIEGMDSLTKTLGDILPREAINLARTTVNNVAGVVRNEMRAKAPKKTGTLRKAIVTKRGRGTHNQVYSDVLITKGRGQKNDAYYWPFVEFGTVNIPAQPFVVPAIEQVAPQIPDIFAEKWGANFEKLMAKKAAK